MCSHNRKHETLRIWEWVLWHCVRCSYSTAATSTVCTAQMAGFSTVQWSSCWCKFLRCAPFALFRICKPIWLYCDKIFDLHFHFSVATSIERRKLFFETVWTVKLNLSQYLTNLMHKICFTVSFISCLYMCSKHVEAWNKTYVKQILCIKLVECWDKYTEMHGQQNVKNWWNWSRPVLKIILAFDLEGGRAWWLSLMYSSVLI